MSRSFRSIKASVQELTVHFHKVQSTHKGYKCYGPNTGKILLSRLVVFNDMFFLHHHLPPWRHLLPLLPVEEDLASPTPRVFLNVPHPLPQSIFPPPPLYLPRPPITLTPLLDLIFYHPSHRLLHPPAHLLHQPFPLFHLLPARPLYLHLLAPPLSLNPHHNFLHPLLRYPPSRFIP